MTAEALVQRSCVPRDRKSFAILRPTYYGVRRLLLGLSPNHRFQMKWKTVRLRFEQYRLAASSALFARNPSIFGTSANR